MGGGVAARTAADADVAASAACSSVATRGKGAGDALRDGAVSFCLAGEAVREPGFPPCPEAAWCGRAMRSGDLARMATALDSSRIADEDGSGLTVLLLCCAFLYAGTASSASASGLAARCWRGDAGDPLRALGGLPALLPIKGRPTYAARGPEAALPASPGELLRPGDAFLEPALRGDGLRGLTSLSRPIICMSWCCLSNIRSSIGSTCPLPSAVGVGAAAAAAVLAGSSTTACWTPNSQAAGHAGSC